MARALETLDSMAVKDIAPNIATYGTILEGYVRAGNVSEAVRVYDGVQANERISPRRPYAQISNLRVRFTRHVRRRRLHHR